MNKHAQAGPLAFIFLILMFMVMWFVWLGSWLSDVGEQTIVTNNLTGIEAFAYSNLNIIVLLGVIFGVMGYMYFGGMR